MKFIVAVALIAIIACVRADENKLNLNEEQKLRVRGIAKDCGEKNGLTKEIVIGLKNGNFENIDDKQKAFMNCFLEKLGFLADGVPQVDIIKAKLIPLVGEAEVNTVIEKCNGLKGTNNDDTAILIYKCYYQNHAGIM